MKKFRIIWAAVAIIISILLFQFVDSLTFMFTHDNILLFQYLVILFATASTLMILV